MQKLIYIADDEKNIRMMMKTFLENEGYLVEAFEDGYSIRQAVREKMPDMIILDIMMPGEDGLRLCNSFRRESKVPIMIVSAKDSPMDRVTGITLGSDDYITKPFLPLEFIARVKALFRRAELSGFQEGDARPVLEEYECGNLRLDRKKRIEDVYSVRELEMLKNAYNRMESKLRESQREKEFFFQNISHDLRTPLASIIGYAQGIQCGVMTDCHKAAGIILSESMRMMSLTESILTLTKMDCHELKLHMAEIDLEEFLEQRLDALSGMAGGEKLKMEPQGLQLYVRADPDLFGRIVENIISNCIRYGKHEVTVRCERDKELAVILIEDDGTGFCTEEIPRAFERFYQGKGGGFGIGLSVVQAGMEYLGGHVEIGNRKPPEHGAFYRLTLPCVTSETRIVAP